jgi:cytoskeletal protein RodZ
MSKRIILVAAIALSLGACSTFNKQEQTEITPEATEFAQDFGKVEVKFNNGEWESMTATASAAIPIEQDAGIEQGMNLATMRAQRNIIEFIQTDLKSSKTTDTMTKALAKNISEDDIVGKQKASDIATEITEKISVDANGIVRGVYVSKRKISTDGKNVSVTVAVDKRSMRAANVIRAQFGR